MTENALTIPKETRLSTMDSNDMISLLQTGGFMSRLQLMTAANDQCKDGEFPMNHYALVSDSTFRDVGTEVDVLVCAQRIKALDMSGDDVISVFDPKIVDGVATGLFSDIQERSTISESRCMWGPEFLVYLANEKVFATFFMGSKSARRVAKLMMNKVGGAATLRSQKIETKKYTWFAPMITICSTPIESPASDVLLKEIEKFVNPAEQEVEKAVVDEQAR